MVPAALLLAGCQKDLDEAEVKALLLEPSRGALAGFDFGDSWEKIKSEHDARYTVRDETVQIGSGQTTFRQLRRDLGSPGEDGLYLTFRTDASGNVTQIDASIYGRKKNAVAVRRLLDDIIAHFDKKIGNGRCGKTPGGQGNSSYCNWKGKDGARVDAHYMEMSDPIQGTINLMVIPPGKP